MSTAALAPPPRGARRLLLLGLALAILLFLPGLREQFEGPKAAAVRCAGLALLVLALAEARDPRRGWQPLDLAVGAWVAVEILATLGSTAPAISLLGDVEQHDGLLTTLGLSGLYFAARREARAADRGTRVLDLALLATALAGLYALVQAAGRDPLEWSRTLGYGPAGSVVRPFGTLGNANVMGSTAAALLAAAVPLAALAPGRRALRIVAAIVCAAGVLVTVSRSAWLGGVAGVALAAALLGRARAGARGGGRALVVAVVAALAGGALVLLLPGEWGALLRSRAAELLDAGGGSGRSRLEIWRAALEAWRARPLLGHGPDTFEMIYPRFQTPPYWRFEWGVLPFHAHSMVLDALATRGALGALVRISAVVAAALAAGRAWREHQSARGSIAAALAAIGALLVSGSFGAVGISGVAVAAVAAGLLSGLAATPGQAPAAEHRTRAEKRAAARAAARGEEGGAAPSAPPAPAVWIAALVAGAALVWSALDLSASRVAFRVVDGVAQAATAAPSGWAPALARDAARLAEADARLPHADTYERTRAEALLVLARASEAPAPLVAAGEAAARRAIALAPARSLDHQELGSALFMRAQLGDTAAVAEAEAAFTRCLALAPVNGLALMQLAYEELVIGRVEQARGPAVRAAALYPGEGLAQATLARVELASGDTLRARAAIARAIAGEWHGDEAGRSATAGLIPRPAPVLSVAPRRDVPPAPRVPPANPIR